VAQRASLTPVLPSELEELVPTGQDDICTVLVKWFRFQLLLYRYHKYAFTTDGELSDNFKAEICFAASFCGDPQVTNPESPYFEEEEE
jgi:hypothetical protein